MSQIRIMGARNTLRGQAVVPGDKSISHRALLLSALAVGKSSIRHFLDGSDCLATLSALQQLGVVIDRISETELAVHGKGESGLCEPDDVLDCKNSGTTIRLLAGILAGQPFFSVLSGTDQIRHRPMARVIEPLRAMGADVRGRSTHTLAPLVITPVKTLTGAHAALPVASAQVKSCILFAGLFAEGTTTVEEPGPARDHTERLLRAMGASIELVDKCVRIRPFERALQPIDLAVPGDMSSAAFILGAVAILPGSEVILNNVGVNPTRTGIYDALGKMGLYLTSSHPSVHWGEPVADIVATSAQLKGITLRGDDIVRSIDELPLLAVVATQANGITRVHDAHELRVKETNRIDSIVQELRKMDACIEATEDGFIIEGPTQLRGTFVKSHGDHRIAMALAIAGLCAQGETVIDNAHVTDDSFPGFVPLLQELGAKIEKVDS